MGVRPKLLVAVLVCGALALPLGASGAAQQPAANVKAEGDPFTPGSLKFNPKNVSVKVGQIVRWTNTDDAVPHTATEDHGLWDLTGTYGLPGNYGFGPGESRQRRFEAGTQHYYCKVHPADMRGVVAVPVKLAVKSIPSGRRVVVTWAAVKPAAGLVYGVQVRKGDGKWQAFRTKTTTTSGTLDRRGAKTAIRFRARLRATDDVSRATGWSPVVQVTA